MGGGSFVAETDLTAPGLVGHSLPLLQLITLHLHQQVSECGLFFPIMVQNIQFLLMKCDFNERLEHRRE